MFLSEAVVSLQAFRILVVEDDADMRALLVEDLRDAGYTIDEAENGLEAAIRLKAQPFDLMVTDLDMPSMNGDALLGVIRTRFPGMPVITISGSRNRQDDARIGEGRAWRHLAKPFRLHDLRAVVRSALEAPH
jgi:CheY-like chemotaxis protein